MAENNPAGTDTVYLTRAQVEELIEEKLGSIKVYISETEITRAQENARAMVEQAEF